MNLFFLPSILKNPFPIDFWTKKSRNLTEIFWRWHAPLERNSSVFELTFSWKKYIFKPCPERTLTDPDTCWFWQEWSFTDSDSFQHNSFTFLTDMLPKKFPNRWMSRQPFWWELFYQKGIEKMNNFLTKKHFLIAF